MATLTDFSPPSGVFPEVLQKRASAANNSRRFQGEIRPGTGFEDLRSQFINMKADPSLSRGMGLFGSVTSPSFVAREIGTGLQREGVAPELGAKISGAGKTGEDVEMALGLGLLGVMGGKGLLKLGKNLGGKLGTRGLKGVTPKAIPDASVPWGDTLGERFARSEMAKLSRPNPRYTRSQETR